MYLIEHKFRSYYEKDVWTFSRKGKIKKTWETIDASVGKVRMSSGYPVETFRSLVEKVANITLWNSQFEMFYRGQSFDYKDKNGKTAIYPSICRPNKNADGTYKMAIRFNTIDERYGELNRFIEFLDAEKKNYDEFHLSHIQHYNILPTPLIDVTQSLRVAATFALLSSTKKTGYVYVFGLPFPHGSISHFIDQKTVIVKLQNVSHVQALRPRYQEGYLVGKLPIKSTKDAHDNLARRLVGKFFIDNSKGKFWDRHFRPLPTSVLFPRRDTYERIIVSNKKKFDKQNSLRD